MKGKLQKAFQESGGIKDFVAPLIFAIWLVYQFIASYSLKQNDFDSLGSDGYARIIAGGGLFFIVLYLAQKIVEIIRITEKNKHEDTTTFNTAQQEWKTGKENQSLIAFFKTHYKVTMLFLCIFYVFLIDKIGFITSSALYLLSSMLLFSDEKRKIWLIVLLSAVFSVGLYFLFRYGFTILLP